MLSSHLKLTAILPLLCLMLTVFVMAQSETGDAEGSETKAGGSEMKAAGDAAKEAGETQVVKTSAEGEEPDVDPAVAKQLPYYPLQACIICGGDLDKADDVQNHLHNGRLVRCCSKKCVDKFNEVAEGVLEKLDTAVIAEQKGDYPLNTCVICDQQLGGEGMGEPINRVYNNRLARLCCEGCTKQFDKDPGKCLVKIDAAMKKKAAADDDDGDDDDDDNGDDDHDEHEGHNH